MKTSILSAMLLGVLAGSAVAAEPANGGIQGVVRFTGEAPAVRRIPTSDGTIIEHYDLVIDPKSKGLRYVAAILEDAPAQPKVKDAKRIVVDQRDMVFIPRVVAVRHGQEVRFDNSDLCNHSVMTETLTKANQFNYFATPGNPIDRVFELQKAPVKIGCALHAWMRAWVYVVPHPWFAVSDEQGRFLIDQVPPGRYTLLLTHPDTGLQERQTVTVEAGRVLELDFEWKKARPD
jgi:plastocyanin